MALRLIFILAMAALLAGCASRPDLATLETVAPTTTPGARTVSIYAVTTRAREKPNTNLFDSERSDAINYAHFSVSIPPNHQPAKVEWPTPTVDPAKTFAVVQQQVITAPTFRKDVAVDLKEDRKVAVFVHGYNFSFQEALFRLAQLEADSGIRGTAVLFSWPSNATLTGYIRDKESATYSRDALAALLEELTRKRRTGDVVLFGHSMGGWLVMETLRQLKLAGRTDVLSRLEVLLAAPDIDEDVFRKQLEVIGPMSPPITVLVSKDDKALLAASIITARSQRVGALDVNDPDVRATAEKYGVRIVDISQLAASDALNHDKFVSLAALYRSVSNPNRNVTLGQVGAFILDTAGATVSSPFRVVSGVLDPSRGAAKP